MWAGTSSDWNTMAHWAQGTEQTKKWRTQVSNCTSTSMMRMITLTIRLSWTFCHQLCLHLGRWSSRSRHRWQESGRHCQHRLIIRRWRTYCVQSGHCLQSIILDYMNGQRRNILVSQFDLIEFSRRWVNRCYKVAAWIIICKKNAKMKPRGSGANNETVNSAMCDKVSAFLESMAKENKSSIIRLHQLSAKKQKDKNMQMKRKQ